MDRFADISRYPEVPPPYENPAPLDSATSGDSKQFSIDISRIAPSAGEPTQDDAYRAPTQYSSFGDLPVVLRPGMPVSDGDRLVGYIDERGRPVDFSIENGEYVIPDIVQRFADGGDTSIRNQVAKPGEDDDSGTSPPTINSYMLGKILERQDHEGAEPVAGERLPEGIVGGAAARAPRHTLRVPRSDGRSKAQPPVLRDGGPEQQQASASATSITGPRKLGSTTSIDKVFRHLVEGNRLGIFGNAALMRIASHAGYGAESLLGVDPNDIAELLRNHYPDPVQWAYHARDEIALRHARPEILEGELSQTEEAIRSPDFHTYATHQQTGIMAFREFYDTSLDRELASPEAWRRRAEAMDLLATFIYGEDEWNNFRQKIDFSFEAHLAPDIIKTSTEAAKRDWVFTEAISPGEGLAVEHVVTPMPVSEQDWDTSSDLRGDVRCVISVGADAWAVVDPPRGRHARPSDGMALIPVHRGRLVSTGAAALEGSEGRINLGVSGGTRAAGRNNGASLRWTTERIIVYSKPGERQPVSVQFAHRVPATPVGG